MRFDCRCKQVWRDCGAGAGGHCAHASARVTAVASWVGKGRRLLAALGRVPLVEAALADFRCRRKAEPQHKAQNITQCMIRRLHSHTATLPQQENTEERKVYHLVSQPHCTARRRARITMHSVHRITCATDGTSHAQAHMSRSMAREANAQHTIQTCATSRAF